MHTSLLFVLLLALPLVAALDLEDKIYVQRKREEYRKDLFKFITELKLKNQLQAVFDDFVVCKINTDQAFTRITDLFPTFYPNEQIRQLFPNPFLSFLKRNLVGLASVFVVFDSMEKARVCPNKSTPKPPQKQPKKSTKGNASTKANKTAKPTKKPKIVTQILTADTTIFPFPTKANN